MAGCLAGTACLRGAASDAPGGGVQLLDLATAKVVAYRE